MVRRFGRVLPDTWGPGLHLGLPLGLDRAERVETGRVRRVEVGLAETPGPEDEPGAGEYLTGDLNLIHARAVVQYRVADPAKYVLAAEGREAILNRLAEASLAQALSRRGVDGALRDGRAAIAADVQSTFEQSARAYGLGLAVLGVSLTDAQPPVEVQPDFAAAQSARSDLERKRNEARARAEGVLIAAKAKARATEEIARAEAERAVAMARGRADRFVALLAAADRSRALTVRRLYLDGLRDGLARVRRKVLLTPEEPIDLSLFGPDPAREPATRSGEAGILVVPRAEPRRREGPAPGPLCKGANVRTPTETAEFVDDHPGTSPRWPGRGRRARPARPRAGPRGPGRARRRARGTGKGLSGPGAAGLSPSRPSRRPSGRGRDRARGRARGPSRRRGPPRGESTRCRGDLR